MEDVQGKERIGNQEMIIEAIMLMLWAGEIDVRCNRNEKMNEIFHTHTHTHTHTLLDEKRHNRSICCACMYGFLLYANAKCVFVYVFL